MSKIEKRKQKDVQFQTVNTTLGSGVHQNDFTRTTMNSSGGKRKSAINKKKRPSKVIV